METKTTTYNKQRRKKQGKVKKENEMETKDDTWQLNA